MELNISGPAASIIRGQFVRSRLVSMTSAELLRRSTKATQDDYKARNPQEDPTESFTYHLEKSIKSFLCLGIMKAKGSRSLPLDFRNSV